VAKRAQCECARWLVVGLGNPLAGDDCLGLEVVRALPRPLADCNVLELPLAGARLFDLLDRPGPVLFVDAVVSDAREGTVHLLNLPSECVQPRSFTALSTHAWNLGEVLSLRSALGLTSPRIVLLGIEISDATPGVSSSKVLRNTAAEVAQVLPEVMQFLDEREGELSGLPHRFANATALKEFFALESASRDGVTGVPARARGSGTMIEN
jgi:hydrogenase maturation protease